MKDKSGTQHVFIDSNIFLDFYRLAASDLRKLNDLVDLIEEGKIHLYLTQQVYNEFFRNRENTFKETFKGFLESKVAVQMSPIFKGYPEYSKISELQRELEKVKLDLKEKIEKDMDSRNLVADKIVRGIFEATEILNSEQFLDKAIIRHRLGNPPGKKDNSYGDEINWEALLFYVPVNTDLIIVSNDGDYESKFFEGKLNSFLKSEWKNKKSKIFFYKTLGEFFNKHNISITLEIEQEKNELIEKLINSRSFTNTHEVIRRLEKIGSFSEDQIKGIVTAYLGNSQVRSIRKDPDLHRFYIKHINQKLHLLDLVQQQEILELMKDALIEFKDDEIF